MTRPTLPNDRLDPVRPVTSQAAAEVLVHLRAALRSPDYDPPLLPSAALQILEMTRRTDTSFRDILTVIESDPMVATKVLRVAQSAFYSRLEPVRTLEQALLRLGMGALGNMFLQVAMTTRVFRAPGYEAPMMALRNHAVAVAHASRLVARRVALQEDLAFLCGLLHDLGAVIGLIVLAEGSKPKLPPPFDVARMAVVQVQIEAAALLCHLWNLDQDVPTVIAQHHDPIGGGVGHPLSYALTVGDHLAIECGFAGPLDETTDRMVAMDALSIDGRMWRQLKVEFEVMSASLR